MTREKGALSKDDRIDALAIAVKWYVDYMAKDADRSMSQRKDSMIEDEIRQVVKSMQSGDAIALGSPIESVNKNWLNRRN